MSASTGSSNDISQFSREMSRRWFREANDGILDNPRVRVRHDDGRAYLRSTEERYDLVFALFARNHYQDRLTGTHFLTPEMEKRSGTIAELYTSENLVDIQ